MERLQEAVRLASEQCNYLGQKDKLKAFEKHKNFLEALTERLKQEGLDEHKLTMPCPPEHEDGWWWVPCRPTEDEKEQVKAFVSSKGLKHFRWMPKKNIWLEPRLFLKEITPKEQQRIQNKKWIVTEVLGSQTLRGENFYKCVLQTKKKVEHLRLIPLSFLQEPELQQILRESATFHIETNFGTAAWNRRSFVDIVKFRGFNEYDILVPVRNLKRKRTSVK